MVRGVVECGACCCVAKISAVIVLVCGLICGGLKCHVSQSVGLGVSGKVDVTRRSCSRGKEWGSVRR